ncbi:MAG: SCO family protein [Anaerolineae bacterium]|nr:SCO family protein [Anaerolineae bacterium]
MSSEPRKSPSRLLIAALVLSLAITAGSVFFIFYRLTMPTPNTGAAVINSGEYFDGGTLVDPPRKLADFTLTGIDSQPLSLSDLAGKVTLLYFGYTHCPDVCPLTLGDFKQIKEQLGPQADQINFVMISVDGERDTPEYLQRYLSAFDPTFLGMTGSGDDLKRVGVDYGLYFHLNKEEGENYTVDHTASIFMIDPQGNLRTIFTYGTEPEVITEYIQNLL